MILRALYLNNFRVYEEAHFEFEPGLNLIVGPNAVGKTSILEALYLLITGRSFRTATLHDLIHHGAAHFFIEATFSKHGLEHRLKMSYDGDERKIIYNNTPYTSTASLLGLLRGVIIHPDDAALVKGQPALRRHFLDLQIAQVDPLYVHHITRYTRAMRQRNTLLRQKRQETLESWEHEMAVSAAYLVQQRFKATDDLNTSGQKLHSQLTSDNISLKLSYKSSATPDTQKAFFLEQYRKTRKRELDLGFTLVGPHKDDLLIALQDKDARHFASEGQQRSCVATLRLAEWQRMRSEGDGEPIMLVDDVGTSLDATRKARLLEHLHQMGQVFLTATEEFEGTYSSKIRLPNGVTEKHSRP